MKTVLQNYKLQIAGIGILTLAFTYRVYANTIGAITRENPYLEVISWITMALGLGLVVGVSCLTLLKEIPIYKVYPVIGIVLGFIFILAIPIYATPDEAFHFDASYNLSNRIMGIEAPAEEGMEYRRKCDTKYDTILFREDAYRKYGKLFTGDVDTTLVQAPDRSHGDANVAAYAIPALGITLGRLLHLNFPLMAMLGTLFNTVWFVLWMTYALKKIPFGHRILMMVVLLPITLQEVNSYSRDNPLIASSILVIALTLRWRYSGEKLKMSEVLVYIVSSYILLTVKSALYAYLIPFAVVILARKEWFAGKNGKIVIGGLLALVLAGVVFFIPLHGWDKIYNLLSTECYIERSDVYGYSPWYYMTHLGELFTILARTVKTAMKGYILQLAGHGMGWLEIYNSQKDHAAYIILALVAAIRIKGEDIPLGIRTRIWSVLFGIMGIFLCMVAMLVFWNPKNAYIVDGLQGRYFVPVLLPIFLGLGYWKKPVIPIDLNKYYPILLAGMGYVIAVNVLRYNVLV